MLANLSRRRYLLLWQILLILLGTTWLWAPHLNHNLSYRTALISQYETGFQPYSWLFRAGDFLAGSLVLVMGRFMFQRTAPKISGWLMVAIGAGMMLDPLLATTCRQVGSACQEYFSLPFLLHAIETTITSLSFFALGVYDAYVRKRLVSVVFVIFQVVYGLLFVSQLANQQHFNTISQYVYEVTLIVWLAWFGRDYLRPNNFPFKKRELSLVKDTTAAWAFLNGILAILISLAHIHLLGRLKAFYFAGDNAWLAQHGVVVGILMLYLSRHLARGERRARQIFLAVVGIEALKYSLVSPHPLLMMSYLLTFCALFVFRDDFRRGTVPMTWRMRLREVYFMLASLLAAALAALVSLDRDSRVATITGRTFDNFFDYAAGRDSHPSHLRSVLLAHTITAFIITAAAILLWILFRPYRTRRGVGRDYALIETTLKKYSVSSEDFFKLWPKDKDYFWSKDGAFIAYRRAGPIVFGLADPVGKNSGKALNDFLEWARDRRLRACFMPVYTSSQKLYEKANLALLQIGSSAVIDIGHFLNVTANDKWWRWKRNRAEKRGYSYGVSEAPHAADFLKQLGSVSRAWLHIGGHAERGFALGYFNEDYLNQCRVHYLKDGGGQVIAFANQLPQFNNLRTATIDLLRYSPEHDDSMPYLLLGAIGSMDKEGFEYFDLGFVPFAKAEGPLLSIAQALGGSRFSSKGLEQFKDRFDPDWQPNYIAYDGDLADLALVALNIERVMDTDL
jgi:lysylphosphatidylglycerol synthetase-like protein (DUF2156 family)